ncbi:MAG: hypothetical protein GWP23_02205 [Synechococcales cyanobacterium H12SWP_bin.12]|nr:hypothetical protein [Synechococcales cyanobacterium H12SWP_bin.12]
MTSTQIKFIGENHETFLRYRSNHPDGNSSPSKHRDEGPKSPDGEALLR